MSLHELSVVRLATCSSKCYLFVTQWDHRSAGNSKLGAPLKDEGSGSAGEGTKSTDAVLDASSAVEGLQTKSGSHCAQSVLLGLLLRFQVLESAPHFFLEPQLIPHGWEKHYVARCVIGGLTCSKHSHICISYNTSLSVCMPPEQDNEVLWLIYSHSARCSTHSAVYQCVY